MSVESSWRPDQQLAAIRQLLADLSQQSEITAQHSLDQIGSTLDQLSGTLNQQQTIIDQAEQRSTDLLDVMMSMAAGDYTKRAQILDGDTLFDALAAGLNMLADEFVAAQEERTRLQEEVILSQAAVIQELSTPLIPINNDILIMPLIGHIDSARALHVVERLLEGVAANHTQTVILDITGVLIVDTQVANTLVRAAQAVRLLGTQMVLTGIRPDVAQTLVTLGVELRGIMTWSTLQMGVSYALRQANQQQLKPINW